VDAVRRELSVHATVVEKNGLVVGGASDAAAADFHLLFPGGENHVDQADFAQFFEDSTRLVAKAAGSGHLVERLPKDVGQGAVQNVRQHAVSLLMPDRGDPQVTLMNPERKFNLPAIMRRLSQLL